MPIVNVPVEPFVQPPYRAKVVDAAGMRMPLDFSNVVVHERDDYGARLIVHDRSQSDEVFLEVHNAYNKEGTEELENSRMEAFALNNRQRYELAIYLLSTVTYK